MRKFSEEQVRARLQREARDASHRELGTRYGVSASIICDAINGRRIVPKLAEALGFRRVVLYEATE